MRRIMLGLVALVTLSSMANASLKYECSRYVGGDYKGFIKVVANSKEEAENKAYKKYKNELKIKVDYVKCK